MSFTHIFATLDRAVESTLSTNPTHILLGHVEMGQLRRAFEALGAPLETLSSIQHRGLRIIPVEVPTLIQVGTLCAPYTGSED